MDQPYDIFAIPYGEIDVTIGTEVIKTNANTALKIANDIGATYSKTYLYDIQMLPYCPVPGLITDDGSLILSSKGQYSYIKDTSTSIPKHIGVIINVQQSQFTTNIYLDEPITITDPKIESQTDMYRLCSPNYNGQFEFNPAKTGGVKYFNVDCTYKPYTPYIHVNPNFGLLYGQDFDDARGLICGGDFSLATVTDQWKQYQINNKNYQNTFDRQIEHLETSRRLSNVNNLFNTVSGTIQGALAGKFLQNQRLGTIGAMVKNAGNFMFDQAQYKENIDYTKDQFQFGLDNIQALPYSLNKISAFTANYKMFPFLEYYTCTDEEKEALKQFIKYRSMTVGRVGTIREFIGYTGGKKSFIQGKLIRINLMDE